MNQLNDFLENSKSEIKIMKEFISKNPYPSYDEIESIILSLEPKEFAMFCYSEYGYENHKDCKEIYENMTDMKICRKIGQRINDRGGFTAMQANYYVLKMCTPTFKSNSFVVKTFPSVIQSYFDGIGEWQA